MTLIGWKYQRLPSSLKTKESQSIFSFNCANSSNSNDGNDDSFTGIAFFIDSIWKQYNATSY